MVKKGNTIDVIDYCKWIKKTNYYTKIDHIANKIPNHDKCITTNDFNKLSDTKFDKNKKIK